MSFTAHVTCTCISTLWVIRQKFLKLITFVVFPFQVFDNCKSALYEKENNKNNNTCLCVVMQIWTCPTPALFGWFSSLRPPFLPQDEEVQWLPFWQWWWHHPCWKAFYRVHLYKLEISMLLDCWPVFKCRRFFKIGSFHLRPWTSHLSPILHNVVGCGNDLHTHQWNFSANSKQTYTGIHYLHSQKAKRTVGLLSCRVMQSKVQNWNETAYLAVLLIQQGLIMSWLAGFGHFLAHWPNYIVLVIKWGTTTGWNKENHSTSCHMQNC